MKKLIIEKVTPSLLNIKSFRSYLEQSSKNSFRIIYYHYISDEKQDYYFKNKGISTNQFRNQLNYFRKRFNIINIKEAIDMQSDGISLAGSMAISTDDGFKENYDIVAPILDEYKLSASMFIATNFIDNDDIMWRNKLVYLTNKFPTVKVLQEALLLSKQHLGNVVELNNIEDLMSWSLREWPIDKKDFFSTYLWEKFMPPVEEFLDLKKPYLSTSQIKDLDSSGFNICSHSCSHPDLSNVSWGQYKDEVINSVVKLKKITGQKQFPFSYPFGLRAPSHLESRLVEEFSSSISALLGIKNSNSNNTNTYKWERDLQEDSVNMAKFRFLIMPLLRKVI